MSGAGDRSSAVTFGVLIPARNTAATLDRTLRSVHAQRRVPDEVVVVDDGSTDDTAVVARAGGARVLTGPVRGLSAARNTGLTALSSSHVAFLDADDGWPPDYLQTVAAHLERSEAEWLLAPVDHVTDDGRWLGRTWPDPDRLDLLSLLADTPLRPSGVVVARGALQAVGGFDEGVAFFEDADLWARLSAAGFSAATHACPIRYQVQQRREHARFRGQEQQLPTILARAREATGAGRRTLARVEAGCRIALGRMYLSSGYRRDGLRCFARAWRHPAAGGYVAFALLPRRLQDAIRRRHRRRLGVGQPWTGDH